MKSPPLQAFPGYPRILRVCSVNHVPHISPKCLFFCSNRERGSRPSPICNCLGLIRTLAHQLLVGLIVTVYMLHIPIHSDQYSNIVFFLQQPCRLLQLLPGWLPQLFPHIKGVETTMVRCLAGLRYCGLLDSFQPFYSWEKRKDDALMLLVRFVSLGRLVSLGKGRFPMCIYKHI